MNKLEQRDKIFNDVWYLTYLLDRLSELKKINAEPTASLLRKLYLWLAHGRKHAIEKNILWVVNAHPDLITDMINTYIDTLYDNMKSI
jgi:hypothetical protein